MQAKDRLIFALDVSSHDEAEDWCRLLRGHVGFFKVGLELFLSCGPSVVRNVRYYGKVFLDLKLFDIPNTVAHAAAAVERMNVDYLTVANLNAIGAASRAATKVKILAVPCLTSDMVPEDNAGHREGLGAKAINAWMSGAHGLVCSGSEVLWLKREWNEQLAYVVPGIRLPGGEAGDQNKVSTPDEAIANGADMIVVGRPIRNSSDPAGTADRIVELIAEGLGRRSRTE